MLEMQLRKGTQCLLQEQKNRMKVH